MVVVWCAIFRKASVKTSMVTEEVDGTWMLNVMGCPEEGLG